MKFVMMTLLGIALSGFGIAGPCFCESIAFGNKILDPGPLKPVDSVLKIKTGDPAPDFILTSITGSELRLSGYIGRKNVMLSFIPAAWTPVCSDQWPGYNIAEEIFRRYDTLLIGISTDPLPTLFAWTRDMGGLWFDVVSDFWPHGAVSETYGVLRSNGTAERAIILIDKKGVIRFVHVGDINLRPDLGMLVREMEKLNP